MPKLTREDETSRRVRIANHPAFRAVVGPIRAATPPKHIVQVPCDGPQCRYCQHGMKAGSWAADTWTAEGVEPYVDLVEKYAYLAEQRVTR